MKVLIACEFSGVVREAFRKKGHDAWSCDIIDCEDNSNYHIKQDVLNIIGDGWDRLPPSKDRWKLRSVTYQGIADAMAEQWD